MGPLDPQLVQKSSFRSCLWIVAEIAEARQLASVQQIDLGYVFIREPHIDLRLEVEDDHVFIEVAVVPEGVCAASIFLYQAILLKEVVLTVAGWRRTASPNQGALAAGPPNPRGHWEGHGPFSVGVRRCEGSNEFDLFRRQTFHEHEVARSRRPHLKAIVFELRIMRHLVRVVLEDSNNVT